MQALESEMVSSEESAKVERNLYQFIYLLAISIAADIVPIVGENRILAYHGLRQLNESPGKGVAELIKLGGLSRPIDISGVVFGIAPRINAAGRIGHASNAVKLLIEEDENKLEELGKLINDQNTERRTFDEQITKEALELIESDSNLQEATSTVVFKNDWHKGVVGIVASRLMESYYRPTIVLTESQGQATGSARSVFGFSIFNAIDSCRELLEKYGGHEYAAGLTMPVENVPQFQKKFEDIVSRSIDRELLAPVVRIDTTLDFDRINHKFYGILKQMAPFGPRNPSPVFTTDNVTCASVRVLKEEHLKLFLRQQGSKKTMEAIAFRMAEHADRIQSGTPFSVAYHVDSSVFDGASYIQLVIKDFKFAS